MNEPAPELNTIELQSILLKLLVLDKPKFPLNIKLVRLELLLLPEASGGTAEPDQLKLFHETESPEPIDPPSQVYEVCACAPAAIPTAAKAASTELLNPLKFIFFAFIIFPSISSLPQAHQLPSQGVLDLNTTNIAV